VAVSLDGEDPRPRLGQGKRQGSQPGTDLEDPAPRAGAGQAGDTPDGVGIGDEVLPEGLTGPEAVRRQQLGYVGAGMSHQEIVTCTTPWLVLAICEKPSGDMSTTLG
jgi:hypothetical protein